MENKSAFTVFKINYVTKRNNDELSKAVENRQAFIKNKQGIICTIDISRTGLDTNKNQCSAPAVTALKKVLTVSCLQFISTKELVKCIRIYN